MNTICHILGIILILILLLVAGGMLMLGIANRKHKEEVRQQPKEIKEKSDPPDDKGPLDVADKDVEKSQ